VGLCSCTAGHFRVPDPLLAVNQRQQPLTPWRRGRKCCSCVLHRSQHALPAEFKASECLPEMVSSSRVWQQAPLDNRFLAASRPRMRTFQKASDCADRGSAAPTGERPPGTSARSTAKVRRQAAETQAHAFDDAPQRWTVINCASMRTQRLLGVNTSYLDVVPLGGYAARAPLSSSCSMDADTKQRIREKTRAAMQRPDVQAKLRRTHPPHTEETKVSPSPNPNPNPNPNPDHTVHHTVHHSAEEDSGSAAGEVPDHGPPTVSGAQVPQQGPAAPRSRDCCQRGCGDPTLEGLVSCCLA